MLISLKTSVNRFNFKPITAADMLKYSQHVGVHPQTPTSVITYFFNVEPPLRNPYYIGLYGRESRAIADLCIAVLALSLITTASD